MEPTAQLRTSFTNAESARNGGLELEARRRFGGQFMIGANYTFVDSKISLAGAATQVQTSLERPLAGQSKNLFNLMFEAGTGGPVTGRILYNFFGERISDVGSLGLPDILEDAGASLVLVLVALVLLVPLDAARTRSRGLGNTCASPEAAATAVVTAMLFDDLSRLRSLALSEEEFREYR